jgi:hypothetical protein
MCFYRHERDAQAAEAFSVAAATLTRDEDRLRALLGLGNTLARSGKLEEALDAYRRALRFGDHASVRRNYEIIHARLPPSQRSPPDARSNASDRRLLNAARRLEIDRSRLRSADARPVPVVEW